MCGRGGGKGWGEEERLKDPEFFQLLSANLGCHCLLSTSLSESHRVSFQVESVSMGLARLGGLRDILPRYFSGVTTKISLRPPQCVFLTAECHEGSRFDKDLSQVQG